MGVEEAGGSALREIESLQRQLYELRHQLAGRIRPEALPEGEIRALVCRAGEFRVALLQELVSEVVMVPRLELLPESPCWVAGLLNLRGRIVPVIDMASRLSREPRQIDLDDLVVIARVDEADVGFLVQDVLGLETLDREEIQHSGEDVACAPYLLGVVSRGESPFVVVSATALVKLSDVPGEPE